MCKLTQIYERNTGCIYMHCSVILNEYFLTVLVRDFNSSNFLFIYSPEMLK